MQGAHSDKGRTDESDVYWRVTTAAGVQFVCRVHVIGERIEVRLTSGHDHLVCARGVPSLDAAEDVVRRWLRAVVAEDGVVRLIPGPHHDVVH